MRSAKDLPACQRCSDVTQSVTPDSLRTLDAAALAVFIPQIQRIGEDGLRHKIGIDDLEGIYSLPDQLCSYFDHPHVHGIVIWSRCGELLQIGRDCGSDSVIGFEYVVHQIDTVMSKVEMERGMGGEVQAIVDRLEVLSRTIERYSEILKVLYQEVRPFHKAMMDTFRSGNFEVIRPGWRIDPLTNKRVPDDKRYVLKGLQLFRGMEIARTQGLKEQATRHATKRESTHIDKSNFKEFRDERKALRDRVTEIERFLSDVEQFFTADNLPVALFKAYGEQPPVNVRCEGSTLAIVSGERELFFGSDGVTER